MHLIRVQTPADLEGGELIPGTARLTPDLIARDAPQETWVLRGPSGRLDAHASLWWRDVPVIDGRKTAFIGHYAARDGMSGQQLLEKVCGRLVAEGCAGAVGPANGGTWRTHGLVVERGPERVFLFDLMHPEDWPDHFRAVGFAPVEEYVSTVVDDLSADERELERAARRMAALGVRVRRFRLARAEDELRAFHTVATAAATTPLSQPIPLAGFLDLYRLLLAFVDPQHVLMAEHGSRLVGFIFSAPDVNERAWGKPQRTLVVRTVAIVPDRVYEGLDVVLRSAAQRAAQAAGLERAVYALLPASGVATPGRTIRRYAMFGRRLTP